MRELPAGTVVDGRYTIVTRLGSGGMADVYCAQDAQLGRRVALKILYGRFAEDDQFVERFRREATAAAGLQHQHVVSVYDRGEWEGTSYIAMEFVDGRTLKQIVQAEAPMDPLRAIEIAVQVLRAARFAHRRGVIHRDLKPHNVIVEEAGSPPAAPHAKVADFGIARAGASDMTQTGSIMGTAQYLSPEQAQGLAVTPQSDLYSIGIVLYEMLTARVPFEGESAVTVALKQVNEAPVPPSHFNAAVPAILEDAVLRALAKDPAERFTDADAFIAALEEARAQIVAGTAPPAAPPTAAFTAVAPAPVIAAEAVVVEREEPAEARRRAGWLWALLVGLLVAGALVAGLLLLGKDRVTVPQVVGLQGDAAKIKLEDQGLRIDIDLQPNDAPQGVVFAQRPVAGTKVDADSVVSVLVSSGPGDAQIPNVEGRGRNEARKLLTDAGFEVELRTETSSDIRKGFAIRTQPTAGSELELGSVVDLYISEGPPQVAVPEVVGDPVDAARSVLRDAGFDVQVVEQENPDEKPDTVLAQAPAAGGQAPEGSTVTLTVAIAPTEAEVPDVVGEQSSDAFRILQDAGFRVIPEERDTEVLEEDGVVLAQDPAGRTKAAPGDSVTIEVGRFNPNLDPEGTGTQTPPAAAAPTPAGGAR